LSAVDPLIAGTDRQGCILSSAIAPSVFWHAWPEDQRAGGTIVAARVVMQRTLSRRKSWQQT
jgi:hypothetical protein